VAPGVAASNAPRHLAGSASSREAGASRRAARRPLMAFHSAYKHLGRRRDVVLRESLGRLRSLGSSVDALTACGSDRCVGLGF